MCPPLVTRQVNNLLVVHLLKLTGQRISACNYTYINWSQASISGFFLVFYATVLPFQFLSFSFPFKTFSVLFSSCARSNGQLAVFFFLLHCGCAGFWACVVWSWSVWEWLAVGSSMALCWRPLPVIAQTLKVVDELLRLMCSCDGLCFWILN